MAPSLIIRSKTSPIPVRGTVSLLAPPTAISYYVDLIYTSGSANHSDVIYKERYLWTYAWSGGASHVEVSSTKLYGILPSITSTTISIQYAVDYDGVVRFVVYDIMGRVVKSIETYVSPGYYTLSLNVGSLPAGLYFLVMEASDHRFVSKFTVIQ